LPLPHEYVPLEAGQQQLVIFVHVHPQSFECIKSIQLEQVMDAQQPPNVIILLQAPLEIGKKYGLLTITAVVPIPPIWAQVKPVLQQHKYVWLVIQQLSVK
jgi:hypothetical protein